MQLAIVSFVVFGTLFLGTQEVNAQARVATTTLTVSLCGDLIISGDEECDNGAPSSLYSSTILGRNCTAACAFAPYCGDSVLQTLHGEECDDGNNVSNDFCAADCTREFADAGGGSTGGGGSSASGGQDTELGDTQVTVSGKAYPSVTVSILIDGTSVGTVRTNSQAEFTFTTDTDPGAATLSFWANDNFGVRSATFSTTFDITQGAVTNVDGVLIPPTISSNDVTINPGDVITLNGQTAPNVDVQVSIDNDSIILTTTSDSSGNWSIDFDTSQVTVDTHTAKARFIEGSDRLRSESIYGTSLSLFVGVEGQPVVNSDLNRDGRVDLIDFSILIFWWASTGGNSDPPADINQNGNVGLEDFSILLFNWTG